MHELSDARVNGKSLQLTLKVSFNYSEKLNYFQLVNVSNAMS